MMDSNKRTYSIVVDYIDKDTKEQHHIFEHNLSFKDAYSVSRRYENGEDFTVRGVIIRSSDIVRGFHVRDTNGNDVTRKFVKSPPKKEVKKPDRVFKSLSKNIFIVHGRDKKPALELSRIVEKDLGLSSIILHEKPDKGRTIIEKLEDESLEVGYAFVILTPDDVGNLIEKFNEGKLMYRARQNVVLEFGYFMGLLGRNRVCCLHRETLSCLQICKG